MLDSGFSSFPFAQSSISDRRASTSPTLTSPSPFTSAASASKLTVSEHIDAEDRNLLTYRASNKTPQAKPKKEREKQTRPNVDIYFPPSDTTDLCL